MWLIDLVHILRVTDTFLGQEGSSRKESLRGPVLNRKQNRVKNEAQGGVRSLGSYSYLDCKS